MQEWARRKAELDHTHGIYIELSQGISETQNTQRSMHAFMFHHVLDFAQRMCVVLQHRLIPRHKELQRIFLFVVLFNVNA